MSSKKTNFLKRLELQGFKSFASKTVFDFSGHRSVGIVGPNGSGKSNIIDAIRWALGETGASRLRGDVLKNLIFAGTPKKSASGLAKVTMVFDNSGDILPVDSDEVDVTRKIDRSGTSDFLLNNQSVRLKDLEPMFARARLGSRGLMIIGQGQYDVIVRSSPQERREMIEEVLGLKEYRIKKHSAERRLSRSKNNIEKIQAKIEEIAPHLKFLKKQKEKWDKKSEIEKRLRSLSESFFAHHYHKYSGTLDEVESSLNKLRKKEKEQEKEISEIEKVIDSMSETKQNKEQIREIRGEISNLDKERNNLERKLARFEAEKEFKSKEKKKESRDENLPSPSYLVGLIKDFISEMKPAYKQNDTSKMFNIFERWVGKFESVLPSEKNSSEDDKKNNDLDQKIKTTRSKIEEITNKIEQLRRKEDNLLIDQEKENKEFRNKVEELEKKKNNLRKTDQSIQNLSLKKERVQFKMKELQRKWQSIGFNLDKLHNIPKRENEESKNWEEVERKIDSLKSKLSSMGDIDKSLIDEADDMAERFESLTSQKEDLEEAAGDLQKLINNLDEKIHDDFKDAFSHINKEFNNYFRLMFGGGKARMSLKKPELSENEEEAMEPEAKELRAGVEISLNIPKKKITGMEMLSGGEKTLVSIAALFALVSVSPPPFLVLDEIDAALDDANSKRFADLINEFSDKTQFVIVTHNRVTMEAVDALYGITMGDDGVSTVLSIKLEEAEEIVES